MELTLTQTKDNQKVITDLTKLKDFSQLSTSLQSIQPLSLGNSETTQLITYTLLATAIVGIFVYHYIKTHEQTN